MPGRLLRFLPAPLLVFVALSPLSAQTWEKDWTSAFARARSEEKLVMQKKALSALQNGRPNESDRARAYRYLVLGRLRKSLNERDAAGEAYRKALDTTDERIRHEAEVALAGLGSGRRSP